ncbi:type VI secretion system baseplate subunit TssE [Halomonas sp. 328]|uniref:type VI secretion system baseplate subunit TssE n=1 Tax=Halomonas sp. 328 TaxID=2776704 RepID=UPI0018A74596|nr:type VI secretion system baseplate subunit TssE [Halomonas sp. 328]MBF8224192.1 type VI secretion system baseplate subunit TssE [Halomonas sp. 328]
MVDAGCGGGRLFERLCDPGGAVVEAASMEAEVLGSIKRHLVDLLNSHPGHSESAPELGLLDFNDATLGVLDLELRVERAIQECIERFEPRVSRVSVTTLSNDGESLYLRFQVQATLELGRVPTQATIDLLLNNKRYHCET